MSDGDLKIEVGQDYEKTPPISCPYCKGELTLMVDAFKPEVTAIKKANCPNCGGELFSALMIVTDKTMPDLVKCLQEIYKLFEEAQKKVLIVNSSAAIQ